VGKITRSAPGRKSGGGVDVAGVEDPRAREAIIKLWSEIEALARQLPQNAIMEGSLQTVKLTVGPFRVEGTRLRFWSKTLTFADGKLVSIGEMTPDSVDLSALVSAAVGGGTTINVTGGGGGGGATYILPTGYLPAGS
jgi:hypothetical protein